MAIDTWQLLTGASMTNQLFANGYALLTGVGADLPATAIDATALRDVLMQEGGKQKAGGRRQEWLYSKLFNLFSLVGYFHRAVLVNLHCAAYPAEQ
ncbi:MAG: hypothetical protein F6K31_27140 [Symploca sp. SIO2G7]|nr:hypothetical protein [Symploca sp. SIO2G7]